MLNILKSTVDPFLAQSETETLRSLKWTHGEVERLFGKVRDFWEREQKAQAPPLDAKIKERTRLWLDAISFYTFHLIRLVVIPNCSQGDEMAKHISQLLDEVEGFGQQVTKDGRGFFQDVVVARSAMLKLRPGGYPALKTEIADLLRSPDQDRILVGVIGLFAWVCSVRSMNIKPPPPSLVQHLGHLILSRRPEPMRYALYYGEIIVRWMPKLIDEAFKSTTCLGLRFLLKEAEYRDDEDDTRALIPYALVPQIREYAARFAHTLKLSGVEDNAITEWMIKANNDPLPMVRRAVTLSTVPITALAFSPDGQQIAASGYHEITFWKTADGVLDHRVAGLSERTYGIVYSGDGRWLATASGDPGQYGLVRLWSLGKGGVKPVRDLAESQDAVFAVAFSPDGKRLATAGADRIVRVYETETGKLLVQIEDHADWIFDIAFSPDGNRLASASLDKTSKVFDVVKKESLVTFTGHGQPVYTVAFSPDGKAVATGGEDNEIRVWTTEGEAKQVREIGGFGGTVFKLRYSPDGNILAACSGDKSVRLFNAQNGSQVRSLAGHADWVYSLAFSPDSETLVSGSWDGEVRLWNLADGKPIWTIIAAPGFKSNAGGSRAAR